MTIELECRTCGAPNAITCDMDRGSCLDVEPCYVHGCAMSEDDRQWYMDRAEHDWAEWREYMRTGRE